MLTPYIYRHVLTGSYHNYLRIFETETLNDVVLQADKSAFKAKKIGGPLPGNKGVKNGLRPGIRENMALETLDFNKKILHASWHPRESTIAVSAFGVVSPSIPLIWCDRRRVDCSNEQPLLIQLRMNKARSAPSPLATIVHHSCPTAYAHPLPHRSHADVPPLLDHLLHNTHCHHRRNRDRRPETPRSTDESLTTSLVAPHAPLRFLRSCPITIYARCSAVRSPPPHVPGPGALHPYIPRTLH